MANFYIDTITVAHELPNNDRPKFYMFGVPTRIWDQAVALAENTLKTSFLNPIYRNYRG